MESFLYDFKEDELINLIQSKTPDTVVVMTHVYLFRIDLSLFDNLIECLAHF